MVKDFYEQRRKLTFSQAEGIEPLPQQLQPKVLTKQLRALLWTAVVQDMNEDKQRTLEPVGPRWKKILSHKHLFVDHNPIDEFPSDNLHYYIMSCKEIVLSRFYSNVFDFIQMVLRHPACSSRFREAVEGALEFSQAAYRVVANDTIVPIGSDAEAETLERAFADLAASEFQGARAHLKVAATELTQGRFPDCVRESMHAVESVARVITGKDSLAGALQSLERHASIHAAMKRGFNALYGFTSDEKGIRHPMLDDAQANVDEADAMFMIGACASFVSYLINKARVAGLLNATT